MKKGFVVLSIMLLSSISIAQSTTTTSFTGPMKDVMDRINEVVCLFFTIIQYVAGAIAALMIILAGMKYMSSGDDPEERNNAKNLVIYAFVGLIGVILACPLVDYLVENTDVVPFSETCSCMIFSPGNGTATTTTVPGATTTTVSGPTTLGPTSSTLPGATTTTGPAATTTRTSTTTSTTRAPSLPVCRDRTVCVNADSDPDPVWCSAVSGDDVCCEDWDCCCSPRDASCGDSPNGCAP